MASKKLVRAKFRATVFDRDGNQCRVCKATGRLDPHHITDRTLMPNGGYVAENGISLCPPCHEKAERWHSSGHKEWEEGYLPEDLYRLIGSSLEKAMEASNKLKDAPRPAHMNVRLTPPYGNGIMLSPDGALMCRMEGKRLRWYLDRDLATKESDDPLTIRLKFKPGGLGHAGDKFHLSPRQNVCVVCGATEDLTRHHIVPHCYRKYMPDDVKRHSSYDIMPLCVPHHADYETRAVPFRESLAARYGGPAPDSPINTSNRRLFDAACDASTLMKYSDRIPEDRRRRLRENVAGFLGINIDDMTDADIESVRAMKAQSAPYTHALVVMSNVRDLNEFVWEWRRHFIDTMSPKFLPKDWDPKKPVV